MESYRNEIDIKYTKNDEMTDKLQKNGFDGIKSVAFFPNKKKLKEMENKLKNNGLGHDYYAWFCNKSSKKIESNKVRENTITLLINLKKAGFHTELVGDLDKFASGHPGDQTTRGFGPCPSFRGKT